MHMRSHYENQQLAWQLVHFLGVFWADHVQLGFNFSMLVRAWGRKLAIEIEHLWSWARFMAAQIFRSDRISSVYIVSNV